MISPKQLHDLPVGEPVAPDLVEHLHIIAQNKKLCDDVLSHPGLFRVGKSDNPEEGEYIDIKRGALRVFLRENDVNQKDVSMVSKLLSLDLIKRGYEEADIKAIKRGFALAQYYIERTGEFDPRYFREVIDSAYSFFSRLAEDDESLNLLKREITIMIDVLLGLAQKLIEPKEELTQKESYFYRIAGDFSALFLKHDGAIMEAYEYYETGIQRGNISCYVPFARLLEEGGEIDKSLIIAENGWNTFQNRPCLEDYIRLLYKKGDEQSTSIAGTTYQKYMVLFPADYKPINDFRSWFDFIDFPILHEHLVDIHAHGSGKVFSGEFTESYLAVMKSALARNARIMDRLADPENADILDTETGNNAYQETLTDQLILLQRGAFDLLDSDSLRWYLKYLSYISQDALGYNFFTNFFEYHSVDHVEVSAQMSEREHISDSQNTQSSLAKILTYHFLFLIYHYSFTDEGLIDDLAFIAQNLRVEEEIIDDLRTADTDMQGFRNALDTLPESLKVRFLTLRDGVIKERGEMFVRQAEYTIFKQYGSVPLGRGNDIEAILYLFSLGCFSRSRETIGIFVAQLDGLMFTQEQAKYVGQMLMQISVYDQAIEFLIDFADINDIGVLDTICQIGVINPELVPAIHTRFTQRLSDMEVEPEQIQYFLEQIEEDIRTGNRTDIPLGKVKRLLAMSRWMEGKSILEQTKEVDTTEDTESAGLHFQEALDLFGQSLELAVRDGQENPDSEKAQDEYKETALRFSEFIMHHTHNQIQAYGLLLNIYQRYQDAVILHLLAQVAINLDLREEAHKWITRMDQENDPDATELWLKYFFSSSSRNDKMTAAYMLVELNQELLGFVEDELMDAIQGYAQEQLDILSEMTEGTDEDKTHLLHLERYFAAGFKKDILRASDYWKKISRMIQEGEIDFLNEFFVTHSDANMHAEIDPRMSEEKQKQHHLLTNLLGERNVFLEKFEDFRGQDGENYEFLVIEINKTLKTLSDDLGEGFTEDTLNMMNEKIQKDTQEEHGYINVQRTPYRLH